MPIYTFTTSPLYFSTQKKAEEYRTSRGFGSMTKATDEPELAEQVFVCTRKYVPEVLFKVTDAAVKSALCASTTGQWAVEELPGKEPAREVRTKEEWLEWFRRRPGSTYVTLAEKLAEAGATIPAD